MEAHKPFQSIVNKKARFDYEVLETIEAGVQLTGPEVKSLRLHQASLKDSYILVSTEGVFMHQVSISPYKFARQEDLDTQRPRKLLLHKREIEHLRGVLAQNRVTAVPLKIFLSHNRFKVEIGIVRGKKQYEKREAIKRRDIQRETDREVKDYR